MTDDSGERVTAGELTVHRRPKSFEILKADSGAQGPLVGQSMHLDIAIDGDVAAVPGTGVLRTGAVVAVRPGAEPLRGVGADGPRGGIASAEMVLLPAPLGAARDVDHVARDIGEVQIHADLGLLQEVGPEAGRALRAERRVDRVEDERVDSVPAPGHARVPGEPAAREAADTGDQRHVVHVGAELRREPSREAARRAQERLGRAAVRSTIRLPRAGVPGAPTPDHETSSRDDLVQTGCHLASVVPRFSGASPTTAEIAPHTTRKRR